MVSTKSCQHTGPLPCAIRLRFLQWIHAVRREPSRSIEIIAPKSAQLPKPKLPKLYMQTG